MKEERVCAVAGERRLNAQECEKLHDADSEAFS